MIRQLPNAYYQMGWLVATIALLCLSTSVLAHDIYSNLRDRDGHLLHLPPLAALFGRTSPAIAMPIFAQVPRGLSKKNAAAMPPMTIPAPMLFQNEAANLTRSLRCNIEPFPK